jgi:hypothetical protein
MTEASPKAADKTLAPGSLKTKHLMRRSLRGDLTIDNPYGTKSAFESIKSPTMSSTMNKELPFSVTASEIPSRDIRYDLERLTQRPTYRIRRHKFDSTKNECHLEKNNDPQTMEDNFQTTDLPWISSLRYTSPDEADALMSKEKRASQSNAHPPSFY